MKKIFYSALILLVGLTACQKENGTDQNGDVKGSIALAPTIVGEQTRVSLNGDGSGSFTAASEGVAADEIGIYVQSLKSAEGSVAQTVVANDRYVYGDDAPKYFWESYGTKKLIFSGYYPYQTTVADPTALAVDLAAKQIDWLVTGEQNAVYTSAQHTTVDMPFKHATHKLVIKLVDGNDSFDDVQLGNAMVEVRGKFAGTLNLLSGKASAGTGETTYNIDHSELETPLDTYECLVMPQLVSATDVMVKIIIPKNEVEGAQNIVYNYTPSAADFPAVEGKYEELELAQGYQTTLTFTVSQHDITPVVNVTTLIAAWGTGNTVGIEETDENNQNRPAGIYNETQWNNLCSYYAKTYGKPADRIVALLTANYMDNKGVVRLWKDLTVSTSLSGFEHIFDGQGHKLTEATDSNVSLGTNGDYALVCNLGVEQIDLTAANIVNVEAYRSNVTIGKAAVNCYFDDSATVNTLYADTRLENSVWEGTTNSLPDVIALTNVVVENKYYKDSTTPTTPANLSKALYNGAVGIYKSITIYSSTLGYNSKNVDYASWKIGADGAVPAMQRINFTAYN